MRLNTFARDPIARFPLGVIAAVTPNSRPQLSPGGTVLMLDGATLAFGEIRSPATMANLAEIYP